LHLKKILGNVSKNNKGKGKSIGNRSKTPGLVINDMRAKEMKLVNSQLKMLPKIELCLSISITRYRMKRNWWLGSTCDQAKQVVENRDGLGNNPCGSPVPHT